MNIYFACSITGGREFEPVYQAIIADMLSEGHTVPTAHLAESSVKALEALISPREVYDRDVAWIRACDALVAEVSTPSHGVGYEISFALSLRKPVLCLHDAKKNVSKMLSGNSDPNIEVRSYQNITEVTEIIHSFLKSVGK